MKAKKIVLFKFNELCEASKEVAIKEQMNYLCVECQIEMEKRNLTERDAAILSLESGGMYFLPSGELYLH